jgi:predicted enzyme related to lactoylglutathione lyase
MARQKPRKRRATRSAPKRATRGKSVAKPSPRTQARRATAKPARRDAPSKPKAFDRTGVITHTELASADPAATQAWCQKVLGWTFMDAMPTPSGPYRMWRFANDTGGGIRSAAPREVPGSIPYCEVRSIRDAFAAALAAGATEMMPPMEIPGGMGWIAVVAAPGGVTFGFWAEK